MTEQTYDLTQMGAEVQAIINDANNVKGAGAQTTLTDESVLLKDTNGQYHKILKSSFTEAIRDTLAGLLVNNDKGTTINQIAAIASGDFGSVTPANLASVLGGMKENQINNETDLNTLKTTGLYSWINMASKPQNAPSNVAGGFCVVLSGSAFYRQIVFDGYYGDRGIYVRTTHSENQWTSWARVDNYGTSSLSGLASALGGSKVDSFVTGNTASHRKLVITNATKNKSFVVVFYNQYNSPSALGIYIAYYTANSSWAFVPVTAESTSFTSFDDMPMSTYSGLTAVAFNCDVEIQAVS